MLNNKLISVVIPAFNEESRILKVINDIPDFVDIIIIINDGSTDNTKDLIINLIHSKNSQVSIVKMEKLLPKSNYDIFSSTDGKIILVNHKKIPEKELTSKQAIAYQETY